MRHARIQVSKLHAHQRQVTQEARRFNVLMRRRRFGKTTLGVERVVDAVVRGQPVAWLAPAHKLMLEIPREIEALFEPVTVSSSVQERQIRVEGGGVVHFGSLEHVDAGRGRKYTSWRD